MTTSTKDPVTLELGRLAQTDARAQFSNPAESIGNVDLTNFKSRTGQTAYDRMLELTGKGTAGQTLKEALALRIESPSYKAGSDGDSFYTAASRPNMLRETQNRFKDAALRQVEREFPELANAIRADKGNASAVRHGKNPRTTMETIKNFGGE